ncbi:hypothetical protein D1871_22480 [Nakamurella silvestris]|nr:hypothetical protein D1871_22480 [Nakamurella silvestris]
MSTSQLSLGPGTAPTPTERVSDPVLAGLVCPHCSADQLHSATNGYSSCWCSRCGAHIALRASVNASPGAGLQVVVAGLRRV